MSKKSKASKAVAKEISKVAAVNSASTPAVEKGLEAKTVSAAPAPAKSAPAPKAKKVKKVNAIIVSISAMLKKNKKGLLRADIVTRVQKAIPAAHSVTILTYLSDGKNPKYNRFASLLKESKAKLLTLA